MQNPPPSLDEVLSSVRAANMLLVRLATIRRTHRGDQDEPAERARKYAERMEEALLGGIPLALEVESDIIRVGETKVIGEDLLSAHLCRSLYDEGVRALFIEPGASAAELEKLAWLLSQDWSSRAVFEHDLQASAWQHRFASIHIDAIAERVDIEEDTGDLVEHLLHQLGGTSLEDGGALAPVLTRLESLEAGAEPIGDYMNESACAVEHPQSFERFCRRLEEARDDLDVSEERISQLVFETLRGERDPEAVRDLGVALIDHIVRALGEGRPEVASTLAHWPILLLEDDIEPDWPLSPVLQETLPGLLNPALWDAIESGFSRNSDAIAWKGPLFTLTTMMPPGGIIAIIDAAAALPERALRQAIADGVALLCQRSGQSLSGVLREASGAGLKVALLAIARSADATLVEPLLRHAASPDPDIREAALVALRRQQSARIKTVVRKALEDEVAGVRLEAMRYVAVYRDAPGAQVLLRRLQDHQPGQHGADELRAMTRALMHIMGEDAIGHLRALALQPKIIGSPALAGALLEGLNTAGAAGHRVLDEIGATRPELRPKVRALLGGES